MQITRKLLKQLKTIFEKSGYQVRFAKGRFQGGYCIVSQKKMIIINTLFPLESQVNVLIHLLEQLPIDLSRLNEKEKELFTKLSRSKIKV